MAERAHGERGVGGEIHPHAKGDIHALGDQVDGWSVAITCSRTLGKRERNPGMPGDSTSTMPWGQLKRARGADRLGHGLDRQPGLQRLQRDQGGGA
ncbi:hypothetical protein GCM10017653_11570 [Ancylobacter defluvii]|uniref:Uncharacterized protein n=1 Tax=Ancylobacter defluvii TaxID=1282440 RepID=A0A9W6JV40_9HYPH|nr:hypothetical protein GCM10017653_11570 [Ancylobacter defluvii]